MLTKKSSVPGGIRRLSFGIAVASTFLLHANPGFAATVNLSSDPTLSVPMPCSESSPLTPLCLIPNIINNVLQADIFKVLKYDQRGTMFVGSKVEPHIAVNPADPTQQTYAVAWVNDRAARLGGGLGMTVAITRDGGSSWSRTVLPFSRASGAPGMDNPGSYDRITDPWLAYDKNGNLYFMGLGFDGLTKEVGGAVTLAKLASDKKEFGPVTSVFTKSGIGNRTLDKPTIIADPSRLGVNKEPVLYSAFAMFNHSGKNDYFFGVSTDSGQSWVSNKFYNAETNADPGSKESSSLYGELAVLPNGTLVFIFIQADDSDFQASNSLTLRLIRSFDAGATWETTPVEVARLTPTIIYDPEMKDKSGANIPVRGSENSTPSASVNPDNGDLYIAYTNSAVDGIKGGKSKVKIVRLSNAGVPGQVPKNEGSVTVADKNAFLPVVKVSEGRVGVAFADMRNDVPGPAGCNYNQLNDTHNCGALTADFWLKQYNLDLTAVSENFETQLTAGKSIDYRAAPLLFGAAGVVPGGIFLGDYIGLSAAAGNFLVAFPNTTSDSSMACQLTMNDPATGLVQTTTVGLFYLPQTPNAIAINKCSRNDIFFSNVPIASK